MRQRGKAVDSQVVNGHGEAWKAVLLDGRIGFFHSGNVSQYGAK